MPITNYTELKASIGNWLNRDDLAAVIPDFISLAEAQMDRALRHWRMEKRVETTLNEQYENLPTDFLEMLELSLTDGTYLTLVSTADMQRRKQASQAGGKPRFYRITSSQIEFYPAPEAGSTLSMQYYAKTEALSDSVASNWVLENAPDAYIYGALLQAAPYLGDDARTQIWASFFAESLEAIRRENVAAKNSGPMKMGIPR
tara:strand:+ start:2246 stop:2851 length:606 start_codon:yes stop_codon:yes gene_type:complete